MIRRLVFAALTVFIALATLLTVLLGTEPGSRWLVRQSAQLVPGTLEIGRVEGTLLRGLTLQEIAFEDDSTTARLEHLEVRVNAATLFAARLTVTSLNVHGLDLHTRPDPDPAPSEPFRMPESMAMPLAVDLSPARFTALSIRIGDAAPLVINEIILEGNVERDSATIRTLTVDAPEFALDLNARADLVMPYAGHAQLVWSVHLPQALRTGFDAQTARGHITLEGDLHTLDVRHRLEAPAVLAGEGRLRNLTDTPAWDLMHRWEAFVWHQPGYGDIELHPGELHSTGIPEQFSITLAGAVTPPDLPSQRIRLEGEGDTRSLTDLSLEIDGDAGHLNLQGSAGWLPHPAWDLRVQGRQLDPAAARPDIPGRLDLDARVSGRLDEDGTPQVRVDDLQLAGRLMGHDVRLEGDARISDTGMVTPSTTLVVDGATLAVRGQAGWQPRPYWDLQLDGEDLDPGPWLPDWPGRLALSLESEGRLEPDNAVHGALRLERLEGSLGEHEIGIRGEAELHGHGLSTPGLQISVDQARLRVTGEADWAPAVRWDVFAEADRLDPGLLHPEFPGRLSLRGRSEGSVGPEQTVDAQVHLERLEGTVRDLPVSAQGSARVEDSRRFTTPGLEAQVGENRLELQGHAQAQSADLRYRIDAPALDVLWPGLRGGLRGDGRVTGDWRQPDLDLRLRGDALGYEDWSLETLSLEAVGTLRPDSPLAVDLEAAELTLAEQALVDSVRLTARGHADAHALDVQAQTVEGRLALGLQGRVTDAPGWSGRIVHLSLAETRLGDWEAPDPAPLAADAHRARLDLLCLSRDRAQLCLEADHDAASGSTAMTELTGFPLDWLAPWLPPNLALDGDLSVHARMQHGAAGLAVQSRASVPQGELRLQGPDESGETMPFRDLSLQADLEAGAVRAEAGLSFLERGHAEAQLRLTPEGDTYRLAGQARADLEELRWLEAIAPQLRNPEGRIDADLTLAGTLVSPDFHGELRLSEARVLIPEAGLELTDLRLHAAAEGLDRLRVSGGVRSGPGELEWSGDLGLLPDGTPRAEMSLRGDEFLAMRRPEGEVLASPDLTMELTRREIHLGGNLLIPRADIELRELPPQAVSVTRDERIMDADTPEEPPWQVHTRVTVTLGDQVSLSGFGLTARLAGEVAVEDTPARPTRVEGEIRLEDGRYRAYGQNLVVERGVLVFQGPADNPGLDIRAVRRVPAYDVTAGLAIGGTLQDPRSRVFSTPAMEDSEAMSYLLTGRPLSGASEADANVLAAAVTAFGVEQGGMLAAQIGHAVGLDEFTVDSEGDVDQSALLMGKHLSSRLYLRYTVGLFQRASALMLRYSLSRTLSLETQTSDEAQSMDLIYRRER